MATNVDIGCESGNGNVIQGLYEAIKANGTVPDLNVQNNQANLYFYPQTSYFVAVGVRVGTQYYVSISRPVNAINIYSDILEYNSNAARFQCTISYSASLFALDRTTGSTFLSAYSGQIECCYVYSTTSYDQLMSQLGGA